MPIPGSLPAPSHLKYIAHLDMDAFYASVELLRYPQLRGKPLVIGGRRRAATGAAVRTLRDYTGRGVITTATYEARAFGLHSGMGLMKAAQLAPDAMLLPADFDEYRRYSRLFKDAVRMVAPEITLCVANVYSQAHSWMLLKHGSSTVFESVMCGMMMSAGPNCLASGRPGSCARTAAGASIAPARAHPRNREVNLMFESAVVRAMTRRRGRLPD